MKKGWKILLISCGICAGIGVVLSVAGTVLGGVRDLQEYGRRGMQYLENDHWWSQKYSEPEEMDESRGYAVSSRGGIAHTPAQERAVKRGKQMKTFGEEER